MAKEEYAMPIRREIGASLDEFVVLYRLMESDHAPCIALRVVQQLTRHRLSRAPALSFAVVANEFPKPHGEYCLGGTRNHGRP